MKLINRLAFGITFLATLALTIVGMLALSVDPPEEDLPSYLQRPRVELHGSALQ